MRRLNRNNTTMPPCLTPVTPPRRFSDLRGSEKAAVRTALLAMQGNCCAYCERRTGTANDEGHVEHFRKQAARHDLETDWHNLFWSCLDEKTCGKHKDKCDRPRGSGPQAQFDVADLIDPCIDDPDTYMQFISDGTIKQRDGLNPDQQRKFTETVRVFQLVDSPFLRTSREDAVNPYIRFLSSLLPDGPEKVRAYITRELTAIDAVPFSTAIRHFLTSYAP